MTKLLAFDYGASSGRAILGTYNGKTLDLKEVHRFLSDPVMLNGSFHWDILRLFHEMKQGILNVMKSGEKDISGIGVDTWGVDFGLLGPKGELLGNPYHYRDGRTEGMIEIASQWVPKKEIYEQTGIAFQKFNTLYQLLAMKTENSPLLEKASTLLFIPDLLNYFLTGEKVTEYTIASTSQMYNPVAGDWAGSLLSKLGIPQNILTPVVPSGTLVGRVSPSIASELNASGIPVIAVAGHDTGSAVVSVPATTEKYAYLSSGTWSLMGVELPSPIINEKTFRLNYTNEGGINGTTRLLKNIMGLWIYQECKRAWDKSGEALTFDQLEDQASKASPFTSLIDPDHDSFYSPGNMPQKVMEYCKNTAQPIPETKGGIVRCIMESLALKYRMTLEGLEEIVGYKLPVVHIVGGGSKNIMLNQFTANATGKPVIAGPVEATAIGNLVCQLIALKEVSSLSQGRLLVKNSFPVLEYEPQEESRWNEAYERFLKLVE